MPTDCRFHLHLETGAHLEVLVFSEHGEDEVRWIFSYRFAHREDGEQWLTPKALIEYQDEYNNLQIQSTILEERKEQTLIMIEAIELSIEELNRPMGAVSG